MLLCACILLLPASAPAQPKYVRVEGTRFVLDGRPYYFTGTNFWYGCYIGSTGRTGDRERLVRELDRMLACGIDNLRILGASELSNARDSVKPAIQTSPGVVDDSLLTGLDFLLSEMNKRGMHAVVFLNNFWTWSGGMLQYNTWFGGGYDASAFYRNAQANVAFKKYIGDLVNRKNTVTGLYYYEDPAIMAWELANEPRPGSNANAFYNWIDSTAQFIHSIDPNHLVTTGNEGTMGSLNSEAIYLKAHQGRHIDYATIHLWALNWGWYDPNRNAQTYPTALSNAKAYILQHIADARTLNKPLTMEEFGLPRDNQKYAPGSPTTVRDAYYAELLQTVYDSAAAGAPIAGTNFWGWGGEGRSPNADFTWRVGDPFVCDPPMEKQGLNSIYDADSSTIAVIKNHAALMSGLKDKNEVAAAGNGARVFQLCQNFPNPFNPATKIRFSLPVPGRVRLKVLDVLGREMAVLLDETRSAGEYQIDFDGSRLPGGVYLYEMMDGNGRSTYKKMLLLK
jgi:mannan endo-1,4-beta-mannosidase